MIRIPDTREWDSLGDAIGDAVAEITAMGSVEDAGTKLHEIIWRVAVWHGSRMRKSARIEFAEQMNILARD